MKKINEFDILVKWNSLLNENTEGGAVVTGSDYRKIVLEFTDWIVENMESNIDVSDNEEV